MLNYYYREAARQLAILLFGQYDIDFGRGTIIPIGNFMAAMLESEQPCGQQDGGRGTTIRCGFQPG